MYKINFGVFFEAIDFFLLFIDVKTQLHVTGDNSMLKFVMVAAYWLNPGEMSKGHNCLLLTQFVGHLRF